MGRIVFVGNCQIQGIAHVYERFIARRTGESVLFFPSYEDLNGTAREALSSADTAVIQIQDMQPAAELDHLALRGRRVLIPAVTAHFLWPYNRMELHARAEDTSPFARDLSDSYLNQAINRGDEPEATVQRYLEMDIAQRVNLDRLLELIIDRQNRRDELSGFQMADYIAGEFRDRSLFMTPYHMDLPVFQRLMTQLLEKLDINRNDIRRLTVQLQAPPFAQDSLPIHPSVCRHFNIRFVGVGHRYRFAEGRVTARTFYLRYMTHDWRPDLVRGMYLTHQGRDAEAMAALQTAAEKSPDCAHAYGLSAGIHQKQGNIDAALTAIQTAIALQPDDPRYRDTLATLLTKSGDLAGAARELSIAARLAPADTHYLYLLAGNLWQQKLLPEAIEVAEQAIGIDPYSEPLHWMMAMLSREMGCLERAEDLLTRALALDPMSGSLHYAMAELRKFQGLPNAAFAAIDTAISLEPDNKRYASRREDLLATFGRIADAGR